MVKTVTAISRTHGITENGRRSISNAIEQHTAAILQRSIRCYRRNRSNGNSSYMVKTVTAISRTHGITENGRRSISNTVEQHTAAILQRSIRCYRRNRSNGNSSYMVKTVTAISRTHGITDNPYPTISKTIEQHTAAILQRSIRCYRRNRSNGNGSYMVKTVTAISRTHGITENGRR